MRLTVGTFLAIGVAQALGACQLSAQAQGADASREPSRATAVAMTQTCRPLTDAETNRAELALRVLQLFERHEELFDAAIGLFGYSDGETGCLPEALKQRIADATLKAGAWDYGLAGSTRLGLAQQLGGRDPKIIQDVAQVAFHGGPIADRASSDIRPEARSVLASFGRSAAPWREQALKLMHARDALGTSAAQVAAASADPKAVEAVAKLLREELKSGTGKVVQRNRAAQLVELAYALGAAREAARPYTSLLVDMLVREVQSHAPPFGVIERPPSEVCRALRLIGGVEAEKALQGERCKGDWFLLPS